MGLGLLPRTLSWTGGHPYLTQRFCRAVAEAEQGTTAAGVDRLCRQLFLSPKARERDDNLLFVRERLLRSEADLSGLLDLYGRVRRGQRVADDPSDPLAGLLRLSGIVQSKAGLLAVRNRIYARVFDPAWVRANMPDAELQRQRAAYRRGLLRASAVSGVVLAVIAGLAFTAVRLAGERRAALVDVSRERDRVTGLLYASQMNLAHQAIREGEIGEAQGLLEAYRPKSKAKDLRGFEWRYLWRLCRGDDRYTFPRSSSERTAVAFSPDGKTQAMGDRDGAIQLWNLASRRLLTTLQGHKGTIRSLAFSPDGKTLAAGIEDNSILFWDLSSRAE